MTEQRSNLLPTWFRSWQRDVAELLEHHSSQSILRRPFQFNVTVLVLYVRTAVTYVLRIVVNLRYEVRTISCSQLSQVNSHFPPLSGFLVQLHSSKVNIIVTVLISSQVNFDDVQARYLPVLRSACFRIFSIEGFQSSSVGCSVLSSLRTAVAAVSTTSVSSLTHPLTH